MTSLTGWLQRSRISLRFAWLIWVIPLAFVILFFFYPLWVILATSFQRLPQATPWMIPWGLIIKRLGFTFWQASLSTFFTFLIGLPCTILLARFRFPGRLALKVITALPFMLPTVVAAAGFSAIIGPNGFLNIWLQRSFGLSSPPIQLFGTLAAIILAHVFYNLTIVIRLVGGALERLHPNYSMAASTLGANRWQIFRQVTLPMISPSIWAALALVFLFDFTSFGVVLLLGSPQTATLEVEIYNQTLHLFNLPLAGLLTLIQLGVTIGLSIVYKRLSGRSTIITPADENTTLRTPRNILEKSLIVGMTVFLFVLIILPLAALIFRSFVQTGGEPAGGLKFSMQYYLALQQNPRQSFFYIPPARAILFSIRYAAVTALVSITIGLLLAYALKTRTTFARVIDLVWFLPLGASAVTLGMGILLAFNQSPLNQIDQVWLIPMVHSLVALPFVLRTVGPAIEAIPPELHQAAAVLGSSPSQIFFKVDLPILKQPVISAMIFAFTISLGEFGATTFLARPDAPTIPVAIFRYLSQPGALNFGQAMAMASILLMVCTAGILSLQLFHLPSGEV